ncbi:MAG: type I restriction endonuclease subunit R [Paracoccaceae bacterium]|nr:type I restriction endonuclease subunit R [Paracoccaceae bacterium]MDE2915862.1 type I restriction endonuclease subunit R [Paracoccaceae bacterium]
MSDPNQVYDLERKLLGFGYLDRGEIDRFAQIWFRRPFGESDRPRLEGLVKMAVARFETDDDEVRQEEFRQLFRSFERFYTFIAQVVQLEDTDLEKLACYGAWLSRLLPNRELPPDIEVTEDMLDLKAFRVDKKEEGSASLQAGETRELAPISAFGAKPYTEEEKEELSEIVKAFNERHGTRFTEADMIRLEQVNRDILDDDLSEMLRKNPPDVVYPAFEKAFFKGSIRMFQRTNEMQNIILSDQEIRDKVTHHFFNRAMREVRLDA